MLYVIGIWKFVKNEITIELLCQQTHLALIMSWTCLMSMKIWKIWRILSLSTFVTMCVTHQRQSGGTKSGNT